MLKYLLGENIVSSSISKIYLKVGKHGNANNVVNSATLS
jgi:hypothetical protein